MLIKFIRKVTFKKDGTAVSLIPKIIVELMNKEKNYEIEWILKDGMLQIKPLKL